MAYKSFLLHMIRHRRYGYQRTSLVRCMTGPLTAAPLIFLLCVGIELHGNGMDFASFTTAHRTISFLEPLCCSLRVKCAIVKKHIGNCMRICPNHLYLCKTNLLVLHVHRKELLGARLECSSCSILPAVQLARKVSKSHIYTAGSASWEML